MWRTGGPLSEASRGGEPGRGGVAAFQMWLALPSSVELAEPESLYVNVKFPISPISPSGPDRLARDCCRIRILQGDRPSLSRDFKLEMILGHPPDTASMNFDGSRSIVWVDSELHRGSNRLEFNCAV